jgi:hypothetical protein
MPISLDSHSRFKETQPIVVDGKETFGMWKIPSFLTQPMDEQLDVVRVTVDNTRAGRIDLLARDLYGSYVYGWILIAFNKPKNPVGWPATGEVIRAPSANIVLSNL